MTEVSYSMLTQQDTFSNRQSNSNSTDSSSTQHEMDATHSVFHMDELPIDETGSIRFTSPSPSPPLSTSPDQSPRYSKLPMGRLRRMAPSNITGEQQLEFPAMYVQGFHEGHVMFNIPGVLQDSLKPTDSITLRLNLFTSPQLSDHAGDPGETIYESQSRFIAPQTDPDQPSELAHDVDSTGRDAPGGRFGRSWTHQTDDTSPPGPLLSNMVPQTSTHLQTMTGALYNNSMATTNCSDSQLGFSTEQVTQQSDWIPQLNSRFSSALRFEQDSTDSGLHFHDSNDHQQFNAETESASRIGPTSSSHSRFLHFHM